MSEELRLCRRQLLLTISKTAQVMARVLKEKPKADVYPRIQGKLRAWVFVIFNPRRTSLPDVFEPTCSYCVWQLEKSRIKDGIQVLQGFIQFPEPVDKDFLMQRLQARWNPSVAHDLKSIANATKDRDRIEGPWSFGQVPVAVVDIFEALNQNKWIYEHLQREFDAAMDDVDVCSLLNKESGHCPKKLITPYKDLLNPCLASYKKGKKLPLSRSTHALPSEVHVPSFQRERRPY